MVRLARFQGWLLLLLLLGTCAFQRAPSLEDEIRAVLRDKLLEKATVGVEIIRIGPDPTVLFRHHHDVPLIPASNLKIVTTAASLERLGPNFQFRTVLAIRGDDVAIIGDGDPTVGDLELLKKAGWEIDTLFKQWSEVLKDRGMTRVNHVVVDDSVFDDVAFHPSWPLNQEHRRYMSQVWGLSLNTNLVELWVTPTNMGEAVRFRVDPATKYVTIRNRCVTGSENAISLTRPRNSNDLTLAGQTTGTRPVAVQVTIHDGPMYAGTVFLETLERTGVEVRGGVVRDRNVRASIVNNTDGESRWTIVAIHETPLQTVLDRANKDSNNLYAESLCKRMGFASTNAGGSWQSGIGVMTDFLTTTVGVKQGEFQFDDASGLSRKNTISANALAQVLTYMHQSPLRDRWIASLAVAGVDGTLDDRFRTTDLRGRVYAKSGFISGVSSLSGYVRGKDDKWYAFSILMNGIPEGNNSGAKQLQERIVRAVDAQAVRQ